MDHPLEKTPRLRSCPLSKRWTSRWCANVPWPASPPLLGSTRRFSKQRHLALRLVQWNAQTFFQRYERRTRKKVGYLQDVLRKQRVQVAVVFETHGLLHEVQRHLQLISKQYHVYHSPCFESPSELDTNTDDVARWEVENPLRSTGGLLVLIAKSFFATPDNIHVEHVWPGRIVRINLLHEGASAAEADSSQEIWGIHNEEIPKTVARSCSSQIRESAREVRASPLHSFLSVVGDFNFHAPGELSLPIAEPMAGRDAAAAGISLPPRYDARQTVWQEK